jgi:hypothetical protein
MVSNGRISQHGERNPSVPFKKEYSPPAVLNDPSAHTPVHHVQSDEVEACEMRIVEEIGITGVSIVLECGAKVMQRRFFSRSPCLKTASLNHVISIFT